LDSNKKLFKQYGLGGPEELPFKFDKNILYFHYIDAVTKKKKLFLNKVGTAPPTIMCVEPDNCY